MTFNFDELNILYGLIETAIAENVVHSENFREEFEETEDDEERDFWSASIDGVKHENMELRELQKKIATAMKKSIPKNV